MSTNGSLLGPNSADPNYTLTTNPNGGGSQAFAVLPIVPGWLTNDAISQWIGPATDGGSTPGTYTYQMTFDVPCTNNLIITGQWAVDNLGAIYIDSTANSPVSTITTVTSSSFTTWHPFTISGGLTAGTHTLICVVTNQSGPTGLRLELSGSACCCVPPPSGMSAWWTFDEAAGPTANDIAGTFNNLGTYHGSPTPTPGKVGNALCFNGISDYVQVSDQAEINFIGSCSNGAESFTIDAWIRANANGSGQQTVLDKRINVNTTPQGYELFLYYGKLGFQIADGVGYGNYIAPTPDLRDGQWHFIAVTVARCGTNGNAGSLYVDNNPVLAFLDSRTGDLNNSANLAIGQPDPYYGFSYYEGCLDELEIFKRVLTPQELLSIFNAGSAGKCKTNCLGALVLTCANSKIVQCPAKWSFDAPSVSDPCCGSNYSLTFTTVTNGTSCSNVFTRTWQVVDCLQRTATCSQVVTVVNTNLPVLTCASNKTVQCGTAWSFDAPSAFDACCTNLTITMIGTVTNGVITNGVSAPCPINYTRTWQVTDCCTNTATCSQTVTVVNNLPPIVNVICVTNVYFAGGGNHFTNPVPSSPSAGLLARFAGDTFKQFDQCLINSVFLDTISNLPSCITSAYLTMGLEPCGDNPDNDAFNLAFTGPGGILEIGSDSWSSYIGSGNSSPGLPGIGTWSSYANGQVITVDLGNLPVGTGGPRNLIPDLNRYGFLDFELEDDTGVDYLQLTVVSCCCSTNKTVQCGSTWTFDVPTAMDACSGAPVPATILSTVTSGLCPQVITRTWLFTDACGNTNTCSQTVTVVNSNTACTPLLARAGLTNITVWEQTGSSVPHNFAASPLNPALQPIAGGPSPSAYDFSTTSKEYYDVYISDPDGTPDINGCCLTIVCDYTGPGLNGGVGGNIDSVELNFSSGATVGASSIGSIQLGGGITDPALLASSGLATNALGLHDGNSTRLGKGIGRITVCFPADCSSAKTVQCGSNWNFDPPSAYSACCGSNSIVTVLNTVTNGTACDLVILRTWEVTDCCGNKSTCTETVTVVDTTPPVITCQTNLLVVALNTNCQLVIPRVSARATDNCTPASQLVYSQSPPAGQVMPYGVYNCIVTVTVTDLCGNSNHCYVNIVGVDQTGPVVTCPATMTVTNCLVPCVPVTATDSCCPPASLRITQSPPCNTPLGPGITSVTVTVTDCHGNSTTKVVRLVIVGTESFLGSLFNTGVDASKNLRVPNGATDLNYTLGPVPAGTLGYVAPTAVVITNMWGWLEVIHVSEWIAPDLPDIWSCPFGNYTYTNQFVLPAGANAASASISGRWAADDGAAMYFNGVLQIANGIPVLPYPNETAGFNHWHPFTISSGFLPNPSLNTILFVVTNSAYYSPGPTGLRVEYTNALVNCYTCTPPSVVSITPGESLQEFSTAVLHVAAAGTPPLTYQWYLNGSLLSNNGHDSGVNTPTLHVSPLQFSDAGIYTVVISNPCGSVTNHVRLVVNPRWWWQWGWWNVAQLENPLAATAGPDLSLVGTNPGINYFITAGSSDDFGLPNPGGQIVNVMDVAPLTTDTSIQVPLIAPADSLSDNSYTVIMDLYEPDTSLGTPSTLFQSISCCVSNLSSGGQDGVALTLDAANNLHLTGSAAGVPFDVPSAAPLPVDTWSRVAFVVDDPQDGIAVTLSLYLNGQPVASLAVPTSVGLPINWSNSPPTLLSRQTNDLTLNAEFYVSSIQFHAIALNPAQLAGIGSPDNGPAPGNDTSVGPQPVLSTAVSDGVVSLSWTGSPYALQETTSLVSGDWTDSALPFAESQINGNVLTTAVANPTTEGPSKFYRLIFRP